MSIPVLTPMSPPPGRSKDDFDTAMERTLNEVDNMVDEVNATIAGINALVPTIESVPEKSAAATQAAASAAASRDASAESATLSAAAAAAAEDFAEQAGTAKTDTLAARDQTVAVASGLNLPSIAVADAGKKLVVSPAGTWMTQADTLATLAIAIAATPAHYARDILGGIAGYSVATDRRTLLTPNRVTCNINDSGFLLAGQQRLDLNLAASWDTPGMDNPANRAGKDGYRYAVNDNGTIRILCSANSTCPTGYTTSNSRKIGGFHCVPLSYGAISGHALTGFITGDIIPGTVWDIMHLPRCAPEGMTWDAGIRLWADLYGNTWSGGKLAPVYNATMVDGVSSPAFHWLKAAQYLAAVGKRMFWQHEFLYLALGCNEGTNIAGSADPGVAGAFTDTAGRRMVSNNGCEGMAGIMWWWALDTASAGTAAWKNGFDGNDSGVGGQMYMEPNRAIVGGSWANGASCGSRALAANNGPLYLNSACGVRGVAEPLAA